MKLIDRTPRPGVTFRANLHAGIWSVTKDKVFYGDYVSRAQAIASACYGARAVEATGREAQVLAGEEVVPHHDPVVHTPEKTR